MKRRERTSAPARRASPIRRKGPAPHARSDYDFDYAGTTGELDQNEYAGDLYGGGRYGRGPFEQTQRYGADGFESGTGPYGSLQKQFENRYASGGYSGLKTSGRALGDPPGTGSTRRRNRSPRAAAASKTGSAAEGRAAPKAKRAPAARGTRMRNSSSRAGRAPVAMGRTDARIRQEICERLSRPAENLDMSDLANEHLDVSDVRISVAGGSVILEGTVPERRMKPYIEAMVDACPGVQDIDNRLRVRR